MKVYNQQSNQKCFTVNLPTDVMWQLLLDSELIKGALWTNLDVDITVMSAQSSM